MQKTDWKDMSRILGSAAAICWDEVWPWDQRANLEEYLKDTLDDDTWGGAWQIGVAAWKLRTTIVVFMPGAEPLIFGQGDLVWGLGFTVNADGSGGHYDAYQPFCQQETEAEQIREQPDKVEQPRVTLTGLHQGIQGITAPTLVGEDQDISKGTLVLSELLARRKKRLNGAFRGKSHMLLLSVNVGGSREALEWALGQGCNILLFKNIVCWEIRSKAS